MTHLRILVQQEPDASPAQKQPVRVRSVRDGVTLGSPGLTDDQGYFDWAVDGSPGPVVLVLDNVPGGGKYWDSRDAFSAGAAALLDIPAALWDLDGIVPGYLGNEPLLVTPGAGDTLVVAPGAAVVRGIPAVFRAPKPLKCVRGTSTRVDRVIVRVAADGTALLTTLDGTPGAGAPALSVGEVSLARVTVPPEGAPYVIVDERVAGGSRADVTAQRRVVQAATSSTTGVVVPGLSADLSLPRDATYDLVADLSVGQPTVAPSWQPVQTLSPAIPLNNAGQMSADPTADTSPGYPIWIADTGNDRMIGFDAIGFGSPAAGRTQMSGICHDAAGNRYETWRSATGVTTMTKWGSWSQYIATGTYRHLAVSTGSAPVLYATEASGKVYRFDAGTGLPLHTPEFYTASLRNPWGICLVGAPQTLVVVDDGGLTESYLRFISSSTGNLNASFIIPGGCRGISFDSTAGRYWLADYSHNRLLGYDLGMNQVAEIITPAPGHTVPRPDGSVWVSNLSAGVVHRFAEVGGGYGEVGISIDGSAPTYLGIGNRVGEIQNVGSGSVVGPRTVTVEGRAKALSGTMSLRNAVLTVRAIPRR